MTSLNVSKNSLGVVAGWRFSSGQWWLNGDYPPGHSDNNPCRQLPAAGSGVSGIILLADAIKNKGAMTSLDVSNNRLFAEGTKLLTEALKSNQIMTELNVSSNYMTYGGDMTGVTALADAIPDMGAILSVNLLKNKICIEQAEALASILKEHPTLKSLCGNSGEETELDMSGKEMDAGAAIMLVPEVFDNGALTKLILKDNRLATAEAGKILSDMLAANTVLKELDVSSNRWDLYTHGDQTGGDGPEFAKEISKGLSDNRALIKLGISSNAIGAEQEGDLQRICMASGIELTK
jgi:Ran GTPase-activating protein (RanGAP) involved in mRNA processing and transport